MYRLIIDCDTGIDDSLALLYAFNRKDVRIEAITCCFGNAESLQAARNTLKIMDLVDYPETEVAIGANDPLVGKAHYFWQVHGHNGIGDVDLPESKRRFSEKKADDLIVELARKYPGQLILVTLGRLTNIALALKKEPELPKLIKKLVFMGGTVNEAGNTSAVSEANISGDALAADMVLMAGFDATQVGLDVTQNTHLTGADLKWLRENCRKENERAVNYLLEAMKLYFAFNHEASGMVDCCPVHDPLAMLIALEPQMANVGCYPSRVETAQGYTRGQLIVDKRLHPENWPVLKVVEKVDSRKCVETILEQFC